MFLLYHPHNGRVDHYKCNSIWDNKNTHSDYAMGMRDYSSCAATVSSISLSHMMNLLRVNSTNKNNNLIITIDFDANLLAMNKYPSYNLIQDAANKVISIMKVFFSI